MSNERTTVNQKNTEAATLKLLFWWMKEVLESIKNLHIEKHSKNTTTKTTLQAFATDVKM